VTDFLCLAIFGIPDFQQIADFQLPALGLGCFAGSRQNDISRLVFEAGFRACQNPCPIVPNVSPYPIPPYTFLGNMRFLGLIPPISLCYYYFFHVHERYIGNIGNSGHRGRTFVEK